MKRSCITIERQYGSGGREVGRLLSEKFKIPYYDGELLLLAAEKYGLDPGVLKEHDERRCGSLLHDIAMFANFQSQDKLMEPYQMYEAVREIIRRLAMDGPCIFIGRCAGVALQGACGTLDIFIYASSMEERMRRAREVDQVEEKNIQAYIRQKDNQRRDYYKRFADREWGRMENYDLCLNTSSFGYEGCAEIIAGMAERKYKFQNHAQGRKKE